MLRPLHNPRYAGAFAYGRRRERLAVGGKKTLDTLPREQWIALISDAHPGYISFDQYDQQRLRRRRPCAGAPFSSSSAAETFSRLACDNRDIAAFLPSYTPSTRYR